MAAASEPVSEIRPFTVDTVPSATAPVSRRMLPLTVLTEPATRLRSPTATRPLTFSSVPLTTTASPRLMPPLTALSSPTIELAPISIDPFTDETSPLTWQSLPMLIEPLTTETSSSWTEPSDREKSPTTEPQAASSRAAKRIRAVCFMTLGSFGMGNSRSIMPRPGRCAPVPEVTSVQAPAPRNRTACGRTVEKAPRCRGPGRSTSSAPAAPAPNLPASA